MSSTQAATAYLPYTRSTGTILEPVAPSERIEGLDLLRGWAMFGVLWSNLNDWYYTTSPVTRLDRALEFGQTWFIESRFYALLCLLFGVGFAIQISRAQARGMDPRNVYLRRSATLLGIGLIHALLIWHGDILISYALASFALLLFRDATPRQQLVWGILLAVGGNYIGNHLHFALGQTWRVPSQFAGGTPIIYGSGTLAQIQATRFRDVATWWGLFGLTNFFTTTGSFLLGAWAYRSGLVSRVITKRKTTLTFLAICTAVLLFGYSLEVFHWLNKLWKPLTAPPSSLLTLSAWNPRNVFAGLLDQTERAGALLYASLLLLAFQAARGKRLLAPMSAAGRMALTTYLTQSVICTTLFYSYGLGWFGKVGYTGMLEITLSIYAAQLVISIWWLKRFQLGPVEWLWRTLTYGRAPAFRVQSLHDSAPVAV